MPTAISPVAHKPATLILSGLISRQAINTQRRIALAANTEGNEP